MSSVASEEDFACIPGLGENKQKPRVLGSFFDVVDDAFSGRSPSLPSETDSVLDSRCESVIEGSSSSSASNMSESESRSTSAASVSSPESDVLADEEGNSQEVYDDKSENDNGYIERDENVFEARRLLLRNVTIAQADGGAVPADVLINDGKIVKIDSSIEDVSDDVTVITHAGGLWLTPGSVKICADNLDENSHLSGGTTVMVHHLSARPGDTVLEALSQKKSALSGLSPANFGFGYHLDNVNELSSNDVEEMLTTDKGVTMITFNPTKLSNLEVIQTFRRIQQLGCMARLQLDTASDLVSHLGRLGLSPDTEELEEAQVRRMCTLAKQTGLAICMSGVTHPTALEVIKEFRARGAEMWAEMSDRATQTTVNWVLGDKTLRELVIMAPAPEVTDLAAHVQLACVNPLRMLGVSRGDVATGCDADLVLWTRNDESEEDNDDKDHLTKYSVKYVLVKGSVALVAGEGVNPTRAGQFVELTRVKSDDDGGRSRDHGKPIRVERQRSEDPSERVKTAGITLDPAGVTSLDQVPRMFQRRVSAFGVRNQQDSTFSLTSDTPEEFEDPETRHQSLTGCRRASVHQQQGSDQSEASVRATGQSEARVRALGQSEARVQSLTGSRRASVRVHAPPGGLSSGFW